MENPIYIGDAVYAYFDGYGIELRLNAHTEPCAVYIDGPQVMKILTEWFAQCRGEVAEASKDETAPIERRPAVAEALALKKSETNAALAFYAKCEFILSLLPDEIIPKFTTFDDHLIAYSCDRDDVLQIMKSLHAGKWTKALNNAYADKIDYNGIVNGIRIELWGAAPPESCQIVEVEEEVAAHTKKVRTLVCK